MKHLKIFETFDEEYNIDTNKIYIYHTIRYITIGKIKPYKHRNIEPKTIFYLYDIFDNGYDGTSKTSDKYGTEIDFNKTLKYIKTLTEKDLFFTREATPEESEKYYLSLSANKFNL